MVPKDVLGCVPGHGADVPTGPGSSKALLERMSRATDGHADFLLESLLNLVVDHGLVAAQLHGKASSRKGARLRFATLLKPASEKGDNPPRANLWGALRVLLRRLHAAQQPAQPGAAAEEKTDERTVPTGHDVSVLVDILQTKRDILQLLAGLVNAPGSRVRTLLGGSGCSETPIKLGRAW